MLQISSQLTNEMSSLYRRPASRMTVEQYFPDWEPRITGLSLGKYEQYAVGHAAITIINGNGTDSDIIFRARSGSYADPQDGILYVASIGGEDLADAENWESLWVDSGISGVVYSAWTTNSGAAHGGSIAIAHNAIGGSVRVFYFANSGQVKYADFEYDGTFISSGTITSHPVDASMQLGSCRHDEVFVTFFEQVEQGYATWHKPIYGTNIKRYYYSSGWHADTSFLFHTHAEAILKDEQAYDAATTEIVQQWGKRPHGGLAVNEIDSDTACVSLGMTFWKRYGYNTHNQGLLSFIYYRDSGGIWRRNFESGVSDYTQSMRTSYDVFAKNSIVDGTNFVVWSRNDEPLDLEQANGSERLPRLREVVVAKIDPTGRNLTQFQSLGPQDDLTSASIVAANHDGEKRLFAIGWRGVYESTPATFICVVPELSLIHI